MESKKENLSEMEQIHRGLEAFLEKEVYEEYEAGKDAGPDGSGRYEERDDLEEYEIYEESEEYRETDANDESGEYGGDDEYWEEDANGESSEYGGYDEYWEEDENNEYEEYDGGEPVRTAMAGHNANRAAAGRAGRKEQTSQSRGNSRGQTRQQQENRGDRNSGRQRGHRSQPPQNQRGAKEQLSQRRGNGKKQRDIKEQPSRNQGSSKGRNSQRRESSGKQPAGKKKHKVFRRFLTVVLVLLLAVVGLWYVTISHLYDKVEYTPTEILVDQPMKEEGVTNILLIGNDSRANGEDGRSDAMILVSISNQTKTIYLTSLLRDIYVEIPGHESNRLNAAYAFGGPELLLETIKQNLDIEVNRYVQVNFQAFANLIDAVGGVELELTNDEVQLVNAYLNEYNMLENRPIDTDYLPTDASGLLHLNGPQALAYSRNRYIGSDFGRTERQRKILEAVFHQLPSSVLTNLDDMIDGILPNLTTNISKSECYTLSLDAPKLLTYDLVQASIPIAGSYQSATIRKMAVLQVDFEKNKEFIRTQIYGEEAVQ